MGNPRLKKHLAKVIGLMQASDTFSKFKRMFRKVFKVDGSAAGVGSRI